MKGDYGGEDGKGKPDSRDDEDRFHELLLE